MIEKHLAAALIPALLTGCFPYKYVVAPEVHGTVTDSRTSAPIAGALVTVSSPDSGIYHRTRSANTGSDGKFAVPLQTAWGVFFVAQSMTGIEADLKVEAPGYLPYQQKDLGSIQAPPVRGTNSVGLQYGHDSVTIQARLKKTPR